MKYVILAAGHGSRMAADGSVASKPMTPLLGQPMIDRLIDVLEHCNAQKIHVVANPAMTDFMEYLAKRSAADPTVEVRPIVTENSYESLREGARGIGGRFIAMTVDAIFPTDEFRAFSTLCSLTPDDECVMALMRNIDDEKPLYAKMNDDETITDYTWTDGPFDPSYPIASAGVYGFSGKAMEALRQGEATIYPQSLSHSQQLLSRHPAITLRPYIFSAAYDVDNLYDKAQAEKYLNR